MKKIILTSLLFLCFAFLQAQSTTGITLDDNETTSATNAEAGPTIITGSWVMNNGWYTSDSFEWVDKLNYFKTGHQSFDYVYVKVNGEIISNFYNYNNDKKALSAYKLTFGGWSIKQDGMQLTLDGWSYKKGKFQYRIVYQVTKNEHSISFKKLRSELVVEEKSQE